MKNLIFAAVLLALAAPSMASDVGVSINIGQPGFYGQIDIGNFSRPALIYAEPVIIRRARYVGRPIYLRVPPGHMKRWSRYCRQYNACGKQVYFVQDGWYNKVYAPRYRSEHGGRHGYHGYHGNYAGDIRGGDDRRGEHDDHARRNDHGHDKNR